MVNPAPTQNFGHSRRAFLAKALLPAPDSRATDAGSARDFQNRQPIGGKEHDLGALDVLEGAGAINRDASSHLRSSLSRTILTVWAMNPESRYYGANAT